MRIPTHFPTTRPRWWPMALLLLMLAGALLVHPAGAQTAPAGQNTETKAAQQEADIDHLIRLVQARLALATPVAKAKWNSQSPITDSAREAEVIDAFTKQATGQQLREGLARRFIMAQIDASKQVQQTLHVLWKNHDTGKFDPAPDLAREVRPQLDQLTPQIITALLKLQEQIDQPGFAARLQARLEYFNGRTPAWGPQERALPLAMAALMP